MKKLLILMFAGVFLFSASVLNLKSKAEENRAAFDNSTLVPTPTPQVEIADFNLDKTESLFICPYFQMPNSCGRDGNGKEISQLINVETIVRNPQNLPLSYEYQVSGGTVSGTGEKAVWDLTKTRPGRDYTITVNITDGEGLIYQTRSANARVSECECLVPCICPTAAVVGGGNIKAGENVTFKAHVAGGSDTSGLIYKWKVSQGAITAGAGTAEITVKTTKEMSGTLEATVEITGPGFCEMCRAVTGSETATIVK